MFGRTGLGESDDLIQTNAAKDVMDIRIGVEAIDELLCGSARAICRRRWSGKHAGCGVVRGTWSSGVG